MIYEPLDDVYIFNLKYNGIEISRRIPLDAITDCNTRGEECLDCPGLVLGKCCKTAVIGNEELEHHITDDECLEFWNTFTNLSYDGFKEEE